MRFVKYLLIFAIVAFAVVMGERLIHGSGSGSGTLQEPSAQLDDFCRHIDELTDSMGSGWRSDVFVAAKVFSGNKQTYLQPNEFAVLTDRIKTSFINRLRQNISACYTRNMPNKRIVDIPQLRGLYEGLEEIVASYPDVKNSEHYTYLKNLADAHNAIYNFGIMTHHVPTKIKPDLTWQGDKPTVKYNSPFNYDAYASRQKAQRQNLENRRNGFPELTAAAWTTDALSVSKLNSKLESQKIAYNSAERAEIKQFLNNFMENFSALYRHNNDVCDCRSAYFALQAFENEIEAIDTPSKNLTTMCKDLISQFKRIYID